MRPGCLCRGTVSTLGTRRGGSTPRLRRLGADLAPATLSSSAVVVWASSAASSGLPCPPGRRGRYCRRVAGRVLAGRPTLGVGALAAAITSVGADRAAAAFEDRQGLRRA